MIRSWIGVAGLAILMTACNSKAPEQKTESMELGPEAAFSQFSKNFPTISLPYVVPNPTGEAKNPEIDRNLIGALFDKKSFKPAFKEKDVPELADNMQSANYFYDAMWQTDGFQAFILKKNDEEDSYWYLSTFTKDGQFIDGMCIGFRIGDDKAGTERRAVINDDQSVQIRQVETGEGAEADGPSQLYEIAPDGRIVPMQSGNPPA